MIRYRKSSGQYSTNDVSTTPSTSAPTRWRRPARGALIPPDETVARGRYTPDSSPPRLQGVDATNLVLGSALSRSVSSLIDIHQHIEKRNHQRRVSTGPLIGVSTIAEDVALTDGQCHEARNSEVKRERSHSIQSGRSVFYLSVDSHSAASGQNDEDSGYRQLTLDEAYEESERSSRVAGGGRPRSSSFSAITTGLKKVKKGPSLLAAVLNQTLKR
jgi:hypothetical protein